MDELLPRGAEGGESIRARVAEGRSRRGDLCRPVILESIQARSDDLDNSLQHLLLLALAVLVVHLQRHARSQLPPPLLPQDGNAPCRTPLERSNCSLGMSPRPLPCRAEPAQAGG